MTDLTLTTLAMGRIKGKYPLPRHNVLLLSCMDLRLINELASFMDRDNLTNRYDHLITAGAGLGLTHGETNSTYQTWWTGFVEHLRVAIELHQPEDIYIVEHRACGAYAKFLGETFSDDDASQRRERLSHRRHARTCAEKINAYLETAPPITGVTIHPLRISTFLMDLRGDIEFMETIEPRTAKAVPAEASKRRKATKKV